MNRATVGIRELESALSATLGRVRSGEVIAVSDRGHPIALLVPVRGSVEGTAAALADGLTAP